MEWDNGSKYMEQEAFPLCPKVGQVYNALDGRTFVYTVKGWIEVGDSPFTLYTGVPDLEGFGYFPGFPLCPVPVETAEVIGCEVAEVKQKVEMPSYWLISFSFKDAKYFVRPDWDTKCPLVWDPTSQEIKECPGESGKYEGIFSSLHKANSVCKLMNKAFSMGFKWAISL